MIWRTICWHADLGDLKTTYDMNSAQFTSTNAPLAQGWRSLSGETLLALDREPDRLASQARPKQRTSCEMIFLTVDNTLSKCAILISAKISFKIFKPRISRPRSAIKR